MLKSTAIILGPVNDFLSSVQSHTGQSITACYQCGKCTAGCPSAYAMDITPRQVMRAIQLGLKDEVLDSSAIWLCLSCETCSLRCPREIDIARVMEAMRHLSLSEGRRPAQKDVVTLYESFLQQVRLFGRVYELGFGVAYNMRSRHPFSNVARLPGLFARRKLKLAPDRTKGASDVRRIAARAKELERMRA